MKRQNDKIAIVIPAYKDAFLEATLKSLVRQTNKNFVVYIGDDASPYQIENVVRKYSTQIDVVYHRFSSNLGGRDLVGQWERCISLTQDESWIWLFSDDDEMDDNCVEKFYENINKNKKDELVHFNVNVIDENSKKINESVFPEKMDSYTFALSKFRGRIKSFVVEYVFSRNLYEQVGGFQRFDLAWNSDDATWVKMSRVTGIRTIDDARVNWRKSSLNISPNTMDESIVRRKIKADLDYVRYINQLFPSSRCNFKLCLSMMTWFCVNMIRYQKILSLKEQCHYIYIFSKRINKAYFYPAAMLYSLLKRAIL